MPHTIMLLGSFGIIEAIQRADKIAGDAPDALEVHIFSAALRLCLIVCPHCSNPPLPV